jgi:hypothetical protein
MPAPARRGNAGLADKYSPLQPNGNNLQSVYLVEVPATLAEVLIELIGQEIAPLTLFTFSNLAFASELRCQFGIELFKACYSGFALSINFGFPARKFFLE